MRFWNLIISVLSSLKSDHPYYLAPPCIYKWNEKNTCKNKINI